MEDLRGYEFEPESVVFDLIFFGVLVNEDHFFEDKGELSSHKFPLYFEQYFVVIEDSLTVVLLKKEPEVLVIAQADLFD